jgi:hypothetical protein
MEERFLKEKNELQLTLAMRHAGCSVHHYDLYIRCSYVGRTGSFLRNPARPHSKIRWLQYNLIAYQRQEWKHIYQD